MSESGKGKQTHKFSKGYSSNWLSHEHLVQLECQVVYLEAIW